jgi:hypothetical protein
MKAGYYIRLVKYILLIALACLIAALPLLVASGMWGRFAVGLACGAGAAVLNFTITFKLTESAARTGNKSSAYAAPFIKLMIYAGVMFAVAVFLGIWPVLGGAAGCLAGPVAISAEGVIVPKIAYKVRNAKGSASAPSPQVEYIYENYIRSESGVRRHVFIRGHYIEKLSGGRNYISHRRFRKLKEVRAAGESAYENTDMIRRIRAHG